MLIESFDNDTLIYGADDLLFDLAVFDHEQCGNATNIKTRGSGLICINVQLSYFDAPLVFFGDGIDRRGYRTAGRTPCRPEIDQNWCGRLRNFRLEISVSDLDSVCAHGTSGKIYSSRREYQKSIAYTGGRLKENILWTLGIAGMIALGYVTAVYARDMVWLLVPALIIVFTLLSMGKIFRK